jgi:L-threonylcarbamoyladenylate synthase
MCAADLQTLFWPVDKNSPEPDIIKAAAKIIINGGLVAFPTETVYGLGANALDGRAVKKIFTAKGRPGDNPLILHVSDPEMVCRYAGEVSDRALILMKKFWPGPLTLVLPGSGKIPQEVSAGLDTLAFRMPNHPVALALIRQGGVPVAAPSANLSGKPSPTTAEHTYSDLKGKIEAVIDGGPSGMGVESTVLDLTREVPVILRPGGVTFEQLKALLGQVELDSSLINPGQTIEQPRSPGMKYRHYAPEAPIILVEGAEEKVTAEIKRLLEQYSMEGKIVGVLCREGKQVSYPGSLSISAGSYQDFSSIAAALYSALRQFDQTGVEIILAEGVEPSGLGLAVANRLRRAAGRVVSLS